MKNRFCLKMICSLFVLSGLYGCTNDETKESVSGQGYFMVDLSTNLSYSRAIDESVYKNVDNYKVSLYKGEEAIYTDKVYSELEMQQKVDFGVPYTITAYYGDDVAAGYDELFVKGSKVFSVSQGDRTTVTVTCKPANAKMSLVYEGNDDSDTFEDYFQDCRVSVKTEYMNEAWTMSKADVGKELYLKTGDNGVSATWTFTIIDKEGEEVEVEGFSTELTKTIQPACSYVLTIKPEGQDIQGGKFGLTITVDDGVTEEEVTVNIPGDFIPNLN